MVLSFLTQTLLRQNLNAILLRLIATALFAIMVLCVRLASFEAPIGQIVFWRSFIALFPIIAYMVFRETFPNFLQTQNMSGHIFRSILGCTAMFFSFLTLHYLPLSQASVLGFLTPIFASIWAAIFLKEKIGWFLFFMICSCFAGVLIILWEKISLDTAPFSWLGVVSGIITAIISAFARLQVKKLTQSEKSATIAFYFALFCTCAGAISWFWGWTEHDWSIMPYLIGAGIAGGLAHIAATEALARAPISMLAPFEYSAILWVLMFDLFFFGSELSLTGIGGSAIILIASIILYVRRSK